MSKEDIFNMVAIIDWNMDQNVHAIHVIESFLQKHNLHPGDLRSARVSINLNGALLAPRAALFCVRIFKDQFSVLLHLKDKNPRIPKRFDSATNAFILEQNSALTIALISQEISYKILLQPDLSD